jgi:UDP-N-acetylglucosamine transferase subunit ALG13
MIFITVGTTPFPFYRMNKIFERILQFRKRKELVIYQHGTTPIQAQESYVQLCPSLPFNKMISYIKQARLVITHGGPATIFQCLYMKKTPMVLPRLKTYGEHINDHQLIFCSKLQTKRFIELVNNDTLFNYLQKHAQTNINSFRQTDQSELINYLTDIIKVD